MTRSESLVRLLDWHEVSLSYLAFTVSNNPIDYCPLFLRCKLS